MNRFLYLFSIVFLLMACSRNDDSPLMEEEELSILGLWTWTGFIVEEAIDNDGDGIYSNDFFDELDCLEGELNLSNDGTYEFAEMLFINNSGTGMWQCLEIRETSGTWEINTTEFKHTPNGGNEVVFEYSLTEVSLTLSKTDSNSPYGDFSFVYSR